MTSIHDLAPSYVHDGLDDSELREFRQHLSGCRRCQEDVALLGGRRSAEGFRRALRFEAGSPLHFVVMVLAAAIVVIGLAIYLG
ncbi:MAG: zf-HC2 domain-containing protein [Acidimicrobiia bacterium]|nr:zf-HC2 domain-containing protein [Acidimicrobiia bacterium]